MCILTSFQQQVYAQEEYAIEKSSIFDGKAELAWHSYADAMKEAAASHVTKKYVVLFFTGSDWCVWCKKLEKELFADPSFIDYAAQKLLMVKVDFPAKAETISPSQALINHGLKTLYGIRGYPTMIFLDGAGNIVAQEGYLPGGSAAYLAHFQQKLD
ncbi:thioredoxin family protein [Candidatus Clavichlamydia salmonicola]|uniref:thioredoxin family protein n=1 Tax=Candidatus Clavichlamydia salmonicola TaxID=469812 RepID=UPI001891EA79|nr:thioredoxin family protein [Candidatus Clavichlamydia salmonicola]